MNNPGKRRSRKSRFSPLTIGRRIRGSYAKHKHIQPVASASGIGGVKPKINFELDENVQFEGKK